MKRFKTLFVAFAIFLASVSISYGSSYQVTTDLTIRVVINTVEKGAIDAVWKKGGEETTSAGDKVIWGFFYASPSDVTWGSENNPDLYVKIWFDHGGRIDVNFFHVSVPDIDVYSVYSGSSTSNQYSKTTMENRYYRHEYNGSISAQTYYGTTVNNTSGETDTMVTILWSDGSLTTDEDGTSGTYTINGTLITGRLIYTEGSATDFIGTISGDGNTISGTWTTGGDSGTFTMSK
ncbi:MAG: hypothetical protein K8S13_14360 [Desulfobacula sp.]|uniref:hypothetical protein n=1 Tax=Desulfobacula sp. TaxID=2593537 RepID=UPI0025C24788|nr:hypothetical protein [Desulfobacula sp.]MCD4721019.1 hypothetical protein [Desulfobacula sp.]